MTRLYYRVGPAIWTEFPWNDDEKLAAFYVLTSPHRATEGLYRLPFEYATADLGWTRQRFAKAFAQLIADGFVEYDEQAQVVLIVSALKWQAPQNPNQVKHAVKRIKSLPPTHLLTRLRTLAETLCPRFAEALDEEFGKPFAEQFREEFTKPPTPALSPSRDLVVVCDGGAGA